MAKRQRSDSALYDVVHKLFSASDGPSRARYRFADWLKCDFDSLIWRCEFECAKFEIDWRVRVGHEGSLLTDAENASLFLTFRKWLILSTHRDSSSGQLLSDKTYYERVRETLVAIDYLLLHADALGLPKHGLSALIADDLFKALHTVCASSSLSVGLYQWRERVRDYLLEAGAQLPVATLEKALSEMPAISQIEPIPQCLTNIRGDDLVRARGWAWANGLYRPGYGNDSHHWVLVTRRLAKLVYPNTVSAKNRMPLIRELGLIPRRASLRECKAVPVWTENERMRTAAVSNYRNAYLRLGLLHDDELSLPPRSVLTDFAKLRVCELLMQRNTERYKTLPFDVVFSALRNAIEFYLRFGKALVATYLKLARAARLSDGTLCSFATSNDLKAYISPELKQVGVCRWSVEPSNAGVQSGPGCLSVDEYFKQFRANVGIWELLTVLYGAVQIIVGTLMARRVKEMCGLLAGASLDPTGSWLSFKNAKSGALRVNERVERPIPRIAADSIRLIERLQKGLVEQQLLECETKLFARVAFMGNKPLVDLSQCIYNSTIDAFCDYFALPGDDKGRRYYIRQHQLRRFFAMLFFWGNSFGGLDVLREFLGHTNAEHVYRYITESTPGALLRSIEAEWAGQAVKEQWEAASDLTELVKRRFQVQNVKLLKDDELQAYLDYLVENGSVTITPEFLDSGNKYRILVKIVRVNL